MSDLWNRVARFLPGVLVLTACEHSLEPGGQSLKPAVQVMSAASARVTTTDLSDLVGANARVAAVNDYGHLAGDFAGDDGRTHVFLWTPEDGVIDLGPMAPGAARVIAMNNRDEVVGAAGFDGGHAFRVARDGAVQDLGSLPGTVGSEALDINDLGQVVGGSSNRGFIWDVATGMRDLGELQAGCDCFTRAFGINEAQVVVGLSSVIPPGVGLSLSRGFVWTEGVGMTSIGVLPGSPFAETELFAVNDQDEAVGVSDDLGDPEGVRQVVIWTHAGGLRSIGVETRSRTAADYEINNQSLVRFADHVWRQDIGLVALPPLGLGRPFGGEGDPFSAPSDMNNRGQIVGASTTETGEIHPTMWTVEVGPSNRAPVAHAGGPYAAEEGSAVRFDGSRSSDPDDDALTFTWDFGDGSTGSGAMPSHGYADDGSYTVILRVSDGALEEMEIASAEIANVPPAVGSISEATILADESFTTAGSFTDPGADAWSATVDYGDGSGVAALPLLGKTFGLVHVYVAAGSFVVTVTVADDDGGIGVGQATVVVQSPTEATETLANAVDELVQHRGVSHGNGTALRAKLEAAIDQLGRGNITAAVNQLEAFIQQVMALINSGHVSATDGHGLIDAASRIIRAAQA